MSYWRKPSTTLTLVISGLMLNFLVLAISFFFVLGASFAVPSGLSVAEFSGRWQAEQRDFVLDITACGERLCGTKVEENGSCGRTVLVLERDTPPLGSELYFKGNLSMPETGEVLHAIVFLDHTAASGTQRLYLRGWSGSAEFLMRRHFPLNLVLVRSGEPVCAPSPTS